jgi:hypothetical protein
MTVRLELPSGLVVGGPNRRAGRAGAVGGRVSGYPRHSVDIDVDSFVGQHVSAQQRKTPRLTPPMTKSGWSKVVTTLDACGGGAGHK